MSAHDRDTNTEPPASPPSNKPLSTNLTCQPTSANNQIRIQQTATMAGYLPHLALLSPKTKYSPYSQTKLPFFTTNPRGLQHRNTKELRLPRPFAKTICIFQNIQATSIPDQSNATSDERRNNLAGLLSQHLFALPAKPGTFVSISSSGPDRKYTTEIAFPILQTWPCIHGARRGKAEA
jgi:hypothetical protein